MQFLFDTILNQSLVQRSSDIHFIPTETEVSIYFRVHEKLNLYERLNHETYEKLLAYLKFQAHLDISNIHKAQSGRYVYKKGKVYFLRVSTLPLLIGTESCVIRIIPQYFQTDDSDGKLDDIYKLMHKNQGLILFSGPTGSGKSTLMYQMVMYAQAQLNLNVITIEDPVEMLLDGIVQISVNEKADITYANSFKAILRCDPDVILIGEIRDKETAKCVVQASLSGHLVLSTIHANDCKGVLLRLIEMGVTAEELKQALLQVTNQRLITDNEAHRHLVYETMNRADVSYFFNNEARMPKNFVKLSRVLQRLNEEGVICEEVLNKYT